MEWGPIMVLAFLFGLMITLAGIFIHALVNTDPSEYKYTNTGHEWDDDNWDDEDDDILSQALGVSIGPWNDEFSSIDDD